MRADHNLASNTYLKSTYHTRIKFVASGNNYWSLQLTIPSRHDKPKKTEQPQLANTTTQPNHGWQLSNGSTIITKPTKTTRIAFATVSNVCRVRPSDQPPQPSKTLPWLITSVLQMRPLALGQWAGPREHKQSRQPHRNQSGA
eukprot:scaffold18229_cov73-Cyclotella_meneghiniana.AAC.11